MNHAKRLGGPKNVLSSRLARLDSALQTLGIVGESMRVFSKTEKGQAEIQTRVHRLPPRLRQALILVDGKRDEDELGLLIAAEASSMLDSLLSEGFIEVLNDSEPTQPMFDVTF
jgi:hypothetical protein